MGDAAAHRDAGEVVDQFHHRVEGFAADVLEVDVDAVRAGLGELLAEVGVLVVDAGVEAVGADHVLALVLGAGHADHAAALELGDLADHLADGAGGGGYHHGFALLRLADFIQAHVGGEAGHAEHAHGGADRRLGRVQLAHRLGRIDGVFLPAARAQHVVALLEVAAARFHHLADGGAFHHRAFLDAGGVGLGGAHAAAHVGVQGQIDGAHQHLAFAHFGHGAFLELEVFVTGHAGGAFGENDLTIGSHGWSSPEKHCC